MLLLVLFFTSVFGTISFYDSSEGVSTMNSTTLSNKLQMVVNIASTADYLIEWNAEIQACNGGYNVDICLQKNGPLTINDQSWDPGAGWGVAFGFYVTNLAAGEHTFDINYSTGTEGSNVSIRRARMKIEEINL